MEYFDCHTHHLPSVPGSAVFNLPMEQVINTPSFLPALGHIYSAGIHPMYQGDWEFALSKIKALTLNPSFIYVGECGLDKKSPISFAQQLKYFEFQMIWANQIKKPLIIHCVRSWPELIKLHKQIHTTSMRIIHGFRGKPELATELLRLGFKLSFGAHFNPSAYQICSPQDRFMETDESNLSISQIADLQKNALSLANLPHISSTPPAHLPTR